MASMRKKDIVLARKAVVARQVKNEHAAIKETLDKRAEDFRKTFRENDVAGGIIEVGKGAAVANRRNRLIQSPPAFNFDGSNAPCFSPGNNINRNGTEHSSNDVFVERRGGGTPGAGAYLMRTPPASPQSDLSRPTSSRSSMEQSSSDRACSSRQTSRPSSRMSTTLAAATSPYPDLNDAEYSIVVELSRKALTTPAAKRRMQVDVLRSIREQQRNGSSD